MDYDHPHRARPAARKQLCTLLLVVAGLGVLWTLAEVVSLFQLRARTTSTTHAIVVGYELAGGKERLCVQVQPQGKPPYFMLVDTFTSLPRYEKGQPVALLSWPTINPLGQTLTETTAFDSRHFWFRTAAVAIASVVALIAGLAGLAPDRSHQPNAVGGSGAALQ